MGLKYLLDTNTIIDFCALLFDENSHQRIADIIDNGPIISVINKIELFSFSFVPDEIITLLDSAVIINLSNAVVSRTIAIRKQFKIKLPDAIIAATALEHDFTLVTRNISDFGKVVDLELLNP